MNRLQKAIQKSGIPVSVTHSDETKTGLAVIYPVRYMQKSSGDISHTSEGHSDSGKFMIFSEKALLETADYGDIISDGTNQYMFLWADTYSCKFGSYSKACMKIFTNGSVVS